MNEVGIIILAAGQGKRMRSSLPKVMHPLCGKPLFLHVLTTAKRLTPAKVAIIIGHGAEAVKQAYPNDDVTWIVQEQQLGTGHAVLCAENAFREFAGDVLILSGDVPLISGQTLNAIIHWHRQRNASLTLLTASLKEPRGYGRVLRHSDGEIAAIVEERDTTDAQQRIEEVNAGIYVDLRAIAIFGARKSEKPQRTRRVLLTRCRGYCAEARKANRHHESGRRA